MLRSVWLVSILIVAAPAMAEDVDVTIRVPVQSPHYVNAAALETYCTADPKTSNGQDLCTAYIAGVLDTIVSNRDVIQGYHICWPKSPLMLDDLAKQIAAHVKEHSEMADAIAASIVDDYLFVNYRCPGTTAPDK